MEIIFDKSTRVSDCEPPDRQGESNGCGILRLLQLFEEVPPKEFKVKGLLL